jgi:hypothetical protein
MENIVRMRAVAVGSDSDLDQGEGDSSDEAEEEATVVTGVMDLNPTAVSTQWTSGPGASPPSEAAGVDVESSDPAPDTNMSAIDRLFGGDHLPTLRKIEVMLKTRCELEMADAHFLAIDIMNVIEKDLPPTMMFAGVKRVAGADADAGGEGEVADDFTPLRSDHPRVREVLECNSVDLMARLSELPVKDLALLNTALNKEKNIDRAMAVLSNHCPGMQDLLEHEARQVSRIRLAKRYALKLMQTAASKSKFNDETDGLQLAKLKRHIGGLVSVKLTDNSSNTKQNKKARTLSPSSSDSENDASSVAAPAPRRGLFSWL